ncbi:MAG: hypothetical protein QOF68_3132 [Gaiellales bacterium]|nr:hypothetical protein [Gaiellales bacterium]
MVPFASASGIVVQLHDHAAADPVQARLSAALADASLRVLYWLEDAGCWADAAGTRHDPSEVAGERATTTVEQHGDTVALIDHARGADAEALQAACDGLAAQFASEQELARLRTRVRTLEATEQRLLDVFETVELIVIAMDLDARMTYVNPFTERLSGWSREEMLGQNWFQMFRSGRESFLERVREGEFPNRDQSTIFLRPGERREIDWYNVPLRDDAGRVIGILGIGRDKTDEHRARRSQEVAERRMQDVFDTVQLIVGQIDLDGRLNYVNEHMVRISGWTREELIGQDYFELFRAGRRTFLEQVRAGEFPPYDQSTIALRSGERRAIEWANVGIYDEHGELSGTVGIGRDVTDQRRAEREVRELAAEHEALERVATAVARGMDGDAVFPLVAEQAGRLAGADGCTLLRFLPGERAMIVSNWSDVELERVTPEGRIVPISAGPAMEATFRSGRPERADQLPDEGGRPNPTGSDEAIRSAVAAPITVAGGMWGALVAWRIADAPLPSDTERRLGAFTSLVGTAIANADARMALAASRKRIVAASDDSRRRLERNLHDGAQQRFVSLSLALRLTLTQLETAPAAAADHLRTALEELSMGLEELRELARGIHPAILTERGLEAAVDSLVTRSPVPVQVLQVPDERLPPEVEAAAYYVVAEALTNVARYAEASRATVAISLDDGLVRVEVSDDGNGGADPGGGSGLRGLADRVEAIGGRLEVESLPGAGTRVLAVTPCVNGEAIEAAP